MIIKSSSSPHFYPPDEELFLANDWNPPTDDEDEFEESGAAGDHSIDQGDFSEPSMQLGGDVYVDITNEYMLKVCLHV